MKPSTWFTRLAHPRIALVLAIVLLALQHGSATPTMAAVDGLVPDSVAGGGVNYNVWPTGDPALDVSNVQWAVDHVRPGGVVRLKATNKFSGVAMPFDFGADGSVGLRTSVTIKGEVDDAGTPLVTVRGGHTPFTADDPSVALEISHVRFDGARRAAIYVRQAAAVTITDTVMVNLLPNKELGYPVPVEYFAASGIEMGALFCEQPDATLPNVCLDPPRHLGSVQILNNVIDLGIYDGHGGLLDPNVVYPNSTAGGIALQDTSFSGILLVGAEVNATIAGNVVRNTNRRAIHPLDTVGSTEIVGNIVEMSPFSAATPGTASPGGNGKRSFGIFPLNGHRNVDAAIHGAVHTVRGNTVVLASDVGVDGPHGIGIVGANGIADAVVSDNTVIYKPGARNAILVLGNSSLVKLARPRYTVIDHNTIDASSYVPLPVPGLFVAPAHILLSAADSTTIDTNTYIGDLPLYAIVGVATGVVDTSHPNTLVDVWCGTSKILFANLGSCTQP
ncbi:MAG TPA: hypothetical protein VFL90_07595 [Methylomirabilota bacterium]|nr:hypothetical protein [Methylomirabilota bacterium]